MSSFILFLLQVGCGDGLWKHVYNPTRLLVHAQCVSVTGTIVSATNGKRSPVRREADGDTHGWLRVDQAYSDMLNDGNINHEGGNLVFEVVCHYPVLQKDAVQACKGYKDHVLIPRVGTHVRITGSFVQDDNHAKWNEIHPVSKIEIIP